MQKYPLFFRGLLTSLLLVSACIYSWAQVGRGPAVNVAPAIPVAGTTLLDHLKLLSGEIRTLPTLPRVGAWSLVIGQPEGSTMGAGIEIDKPGQAVIYPTAGLLTGPVGTIDFSVSLPVALDAANTTVRVLLDSWPTGGPARFKLTLTGAKLALTLTDDNNKTQTIEGTVRWTAKSSHSITIIWDAADLSMLVDRSLFGKAEKAGVPTREPLGIALGNARDFQSPAGLAVSELRLSTAREPFATASSLRAGDNIPNDELTLKMAQGYDRRLYPLLERLRQQNLGEVAFAYALAYADIGDTDRAMQAVTPIARDVNNSLYEQAVFLRAALYGTLHNYADAYEQLQVLTGSKSTSTSVRAQVKQAEMLYEQGDKSEAKRLIGEVIAKYPDLKDTNDAYLLIGLDKFRNGSYQEAFQAFNNIGIPGAPPRQSVSIGIPFELKVADPDMSVRLSDTGLPVTVSSTSGDTKKVILKPAFSRGVYLGSVDTTLGNPKPGDPALHLRGKDKIKVSYIDRQAVEHTVSLDLATDAQLIILSRTALDVYKEVQDYQKRNILDDHWELVGALPKTASSFFRDPIDGTLRHKGTRFDPNYISNIKSGQSIYVELTDPNLDILTDPTKNTAVVELSTQSGHKLSVTVTENAQDSGVLTAVVKTTSEGKAQPDMLEVSKNDLITARFVDPTPAAGTVNPVRISRMSIRTTDGTIVCGTNVQVKGNDGDETVFMRSHRVQDNTEVMVVVEDRDLDISDDPDKVDVKLHVSSGSDISLTTAATTPAAITPPTATKAPATVATTTVATPTVAPTAVAAPAAPVTPVDTSTDFTLTLMETGAHTGIFSGKVKISTTQSNAATLKAKLGDIITTNYLDEENKTGKPVIRSYNFRVNMPEKASMVIQQQNVERPKVAVKELNLLMPPTKITWAPTETLTPGSVYRVVLTDGDLVPTIPGIFTTKITLKSSNGASVDVPVNYTIDTKTLVATFQGEFFTRLGDASSPTRAYFSQTGSVIEVTDEDTAGNNMWSRPAINVLGKDKVTATYIDPIAPDGKNVPRAQTMRIAADANIALLNMQGNPISDLKPGMPFELQVNDPTGEVTAKGSLLNATISSSDGNKLAVEMNETDLHSGVFHAIVKTTNPEATAAPTVLKVPYGGKLTVTYHNENTISGTPADRTMDLPTRPMADADGMMLTKVFDDPKFEVETMVRLGESLYAVGAAELKGTKVTTAKPLTNAKLQESARLLQLLVARFPASDYVVEALYLTARIRREEQKFPEAEKLFTRVIEEYPDSDFVPQALYQLVLLYYDQHDINKATEAAMRLVYGYPKNSLVADAVLRIAQYYYDKKEYLTAAFIYKRLVERFPDNPRIDLITFRMATAYLRAGMAGDKDALSSAIRYYLEFAEVYKDNDLADEALYWAAKAFQQQGNVRKAYTLLTKQLITYPSGAWKAYAQRLRDKIKEDNPNIQADEF